MVVQHLSTCEFSPEQGCGLDRWVVRKFLSGEALAYADSADEGKEIAELLQAETGGQVAESANEGAEDGNIIKWNAEGPAYLLGIPQVSTPSSVFDDWVVAYNPVAAGGCIERWVVRHYGDNTVVAYAETPEEAKQIAELIQAGGLAEALEGARCPPLIWYMQGGSSKPTWWIATRGHKQDPFGITGGSPQWSIENVTLYTTQTPRFLVNYYPNFNCVAVGYVESVEEGKQLAEVDNQERWSEGMKSESQIESLGAQIVERLLA